METDATECAEYGKECVENAGVSKQNSIYCIAFLQYHLQASVKSEGLLNAPIVHGPVLELRSTVNPTDFKSIEFYNKSGLCGCQAY